jgi:hypothetical protein
MRRILLSLLVTSGLSCRSNPPLPQGAPTPTTYFTSRMTDSRFHTADHFLASIEMQISGEPFAQLLGRNLAFFDRTQITPDLYLDPTKPQPFIDPLGYSMAIESYEYSKQPMNNTSFESGAGLSLQFGPLLNPQGVTFNDAYMLLLNRLQHFADASNTGGTWIVSPAPVDNPLNVYGWAGFWPVFAEFESFRTEIEPAGGATHGCSFTFGYAAARFGAQTVGDYECGYISLNLPLRDVQVNKVLDPAALGFALWKQGLWTINYWQTLHDVPGNPITDVDPADLPRVGQPNNNVVGRYPDPNDPTGKTLIAGGQCAFGSCPGVFLGDIPLEGWQGLAMLDEMDNKSAFMLQKLLTSDGVALGGFASTQEAIGYDYQSPLRWWPSAVAVTEKGGPPRPDQMTGMAASWKYFPQPIAFTINDPKSRLRGLTAVAGGFAEFFALTDFNNAGVGGLPSSRATFDGDPFAADNQMPDGEESPHDRALANIKLAVVNMDRLHFDPTNKVMVDTSTVSGGAVQRGTTVSTVDAAYSIVGLRTALRSISSSLSLYSNDTPDAVGAPTALDAAPLRGAPAPLPARMLQLIRAQADFIASRLIGSDGQVANSFDLAAGKPDPSPTKLESEASAIRGLLDAYLATSDNKYRQTAVLVYGDLERRFWMNDVRAFRTTAGESDVLTFTPLAFGTIQGALRQYWKLVGSQPGNERVGAELLERVMRLNKLIANGWDDANADNVVQYPDECTGAGLQMAERALTGEDSHPRYRGDRDHDCVLEIAAAARPAALAGEVVFTRRGAVLPPDMGMPADLN